MMRQFYVGTCQNIGDEYEEIWEPDDTDRIVEIKTPNVINRNYIWTGSVPAPTGGWQTGETYTLWYKNLNPLGINDVNRDWDWKEARPNGAARHPQR